MRTPSRRGVVLLQVIVIMMIMAIIAVALMELSFGRHVMVGQQSSSLSARTAAEQAYIAVETCLTQNNWVPNSSCSNSWPAACLSPDLHTQTIGPFTVNVSMGGTPSPGCTLTSTCSNCM